MGVERDTIKVTVKLSTKAIEQLRNKFKDSWSASDNSLYEIELGKALGKSHDVMPRCNICRSSCDDFKIRTYSFETHECPTQLRYIEGPLFQYSKMEGYCHESCAAKSMKTYQEEEAKFQILLEEYEKEKQAKLESKFDELDRFEIECNMCHEKCRVIRGTVAWQCSKHSGMSVPDEPTYEWKQLDPVFSPTSSVYPSN